jgi:hypothetical protein
MTSTRPLTFLPCEPVSGRLLLTPLGLACAGVWGLLGLPARRLAPLSAPATWSWLLFVPGMFRDRQCVSHLPLAWAIQWRRRPGLHQQHLPDLVVYAGGVAVAHSDRLRASSCASKGWLCATWILLLSVPGVFPDEPCVGAAASGRGHQVGKAWSAYTTNTFLTWWSMPGELQWHTGTGCKHGTCGRQRVCGRAWSLLGNSMAGLLGS